MLHDINLHIPAGSTLAVVGPTGSGKSTLAALIARLWEAPADTLVFGWPLDSRLSAGGIAPRDRLRAAGYVSIQRHAAREHRVRRDRCSWTKHVLEAAEIASLSGEIQSFPQRYETMVGERGITLSGGQKQRTSIARAIVRQPKILILDDALSSVDTDTEERILRRLRDVMRQRTSILISHRVSTVKNADQIIVLREGRIIERGTHDELLAHGRLLRRSESETNAGRRAGARMSDFREEEKLGKLYDSQLTHRLMQYLRPYRWQVVAALSFTLGITALEIAGPYLFHVGIDRLHHSRVSTGHRAERLR